MAAEAFGAVIRPAPSEDAMVRCHASPTQCAFVSLSWTLSMCVHQVFMFHLLEFWEGIAH